MVAGIYPESKAGESAGEAGLSPTSPAPTTTPALPTITSPTQEHPLKVGRVRELFQRSRSWRQPIINQWASNYRMLNNRVWSPRRRTDIPSPAPAEMWPIVNGIVAWMSDSSPAFDVVPAADPNSDTYLAQRNVAADLRVSLRVAQEVNDYDEEFQKMLWDGCTYGIGYLKTIWDQSAHEGLGDAIVKRVDPWSLYPDPDATDMKSAQYIIEAQEVNDAQLELRFPGALKMVGTAAGEGETDRRPTLADEPQGSMPKANPGPMAGVANEGYGLPGQTRDRAESIDSDRHLILECWWRRVTAEGERWWVTIICGNAVLLEVPGSDLWGHGNQPYERWNPNDSGEWYSPSIVELLAPLQRSLNRNLAAIESNIELVGNPVLLEDVRAGLSRVARPNTPGQRLPKQGGTSTDVRWLDPPQMHPQMAMQLIDFYVGEMERISGLSAIVRGATPTGRNAQGVLDSVQEAAFVRIRLALRNMEYMMRRSGVKVASLIAEFYDEPRVISYLGPSGAQMVASLGKQHFYRHDAQGGYSPLRFALHVRAGSTDPMSQGARSAEADTLYAMGAIDDEAVLQAHEFPNWPLIVQRNREREAAMAGMGGDPAAATQGPGARQAAGRLEAPM